MKIRMRTTMAGPGGTYMAGQIADLPDKQAQELLDLNYAEPVEPIIVTTETTILGGAPENTATRTGILKPDKPKKDKK